MAKSEKQQDGWLKLKADLLNDIDYLKTIIEPENYNSSIYADQSPELESAEVAVPQPEKYQPEEIKWRLIKEVGFRTIIKIIAQYEWDKTMERVQEKAMQTLAESPDLSDQQQKAILAEAKNEIDQPSMSVNSYIDTAKHIAEKDIDNAFFCYFLAGRAYEHAIAKESRIGEDEG